MVVRPHCRWWRELTIGLDTEMRVIPATHPLTGLEMRALRKLQRESEASPFVFVSERGAPFSTAGFARMLERAAETARLEINAHPHMLRHACDFKLANAGVDTRLTSATRASSIRCATRNSRLRGSRGFGGTDRV